MYENVCMYVCMYVCKCICVGICVCIFVRIYVRIRVLICKFFFVYISFIIVVRIIELCVKLHEQVQVHVNMEQLCGIYVNMYTPSICGS